ncbi:hypothetical protein PT974_08482 [Cladobotryum mycophilum]|uniref:DRBM domain-containing protein n=1 Tax=Cladobotryum mycophilum TaxID=491253 RepID=A0ABR0SEU9_9HYPO
MSGGNAPKIPIPWDRLRAWIDEQEALERQQGHNTLTRPQIQMLSHIVNFLDDEPVVDNTDYVSSLMHLTQVKGQKPPTFQDLEVIEVPFSGAFVQRWRTVCRLAERVDPTPEQFPTLGFGIEDERKGAPMFKSKKLAKQYAAKYAFDYLRGEPPSIPNAPPSAQASPAGGASLRQTFTPITPHAPTPLRKGSNGSSPTFPGPAAGSNASNGDEPVSNTPGLPIKSTGSLEIAEKSNTDFSSEDALSLFGRVAALAGRMGLVSPTYQVEEEAGKPGFFSGQPFFQNGGRYPPDLAIVSGVYGKRNAKLAIAQLVMEWLEEEKKLRDSVKDDFLKDLDP